MLLLLREGCCLDYMLDCADVSLWESGEVSFKVNESCVVLAIAFEVGVLLLQKSAELFVLLDALCHTHDRAASESSRGHRARWKGWGCGKSHVLPTAGCPHVFKSMAFRVAGSTSRTVLIITRKTRGSSYDIFGVNSDLIVCGSLCLAPSGVGGHRSTTMKREALETMRRKECRMLRQAVSFILDSFDEDENISIYWEWTFPCSGWNQHPRIFFGTRISRTRSRMGVLPH